MEKSIDQLLNEKKAFVIEGWHVEVVTPKNKYFKLEELQKEVKGLIEIYRAKIEGYIVVVNEEGLMKQMPINYLAYDKFGIAAVGPVLFVPEEIFEEPEGEEWYHF